MPAATSWKGFATDILDALESSIDGAKSSLNLDHVGQGERTSWTGTQCWLGIVNAATPQPDGSGTEQYDVRFFAMVAMKDSKRALDGDVLDRLEAVAQHLDDNPGLGSTFDHWFPKPFEVRVTEGTRGQLETLGKLEVTYRKKLRR